MIDDLSELLGNMEQNTNRKATLNKKLYVLENKIANK